MKVRAIWWLLLALSLCWPAVYNRQPFFFSDTTAYIRGADAAIQKATGSTTPWTLSVASSAANSLTSESAPPVGTPAARSVSSVEDKTVLSGRSIYYGALLYLGELTGGFWATIAIQALMLTWSVSLAMSAYGIRDLRRATIAMGVIAFLTPAGFFASYLMPDLFAGLTVLACSMMIVLPGQTNRRRASWFFILVASLCFHASHVLLAVGMLGLGILFQCFRHVPQRWFDLTLVAAALVIAVAAEWLFGMAVTHFVGAPPIRPPFLMARVIDDGPGYRYLQSTCPDNGFKVCEFLPRLPAQSDQFLWDLDPAHGVFAASDGDTRRALSAEQLRFVLAVVESDPAGQAAASAVNVFKQLSLMSLPEFVYDAQQREGFERKIPAEHLSPMRETRAWQESIPWSAFGWVGWISLFIGLGFVAWSLGAGMRSIDSRLVALVAFVLLGVLMNAVVCGVLSTPHDRYQARLAWLVPFCALLLAFSWRTGGNARVPGMDRG